MNRQIVLDTETTGLSPAAGHRITEIGCIEIVDRIVTGSNYQTYINPMRAIDKDAERITGLTREFLSDKPVFSEVVDDFLEYIGGSELIIHNAPFDLGFLNNELKLHGGPIQNLEKIVPVIDTLIMAKQLYPGQRNNLDALCKRLGVDNQHRDYHGALLDSELLAEVYLALTSGQTDLNFNLHDNAQRQQQATNSFKVVKVQRQDEYKLKIISPSISEALAHKEYLKVMQNNFNKCKWLVDEAATD